MNQNILACSRTLKNVYLVLSKYPVHFKLVMFRNQIKATEWFLKNINKIQRISKPLHFSMQLNKNWIKSNLKCSKILSETRHNRLQYKEVEWGPQKSRSEKKSSSFDREGELSLRKIVMPSSFFVSSFNLRHLASSQSNWFMLTNKKGANFSIKWLPPWLILQPTRHGVKSC